MSWQLAAFTILALSLAAGFAWYERTQPDARIIALVGTLAAFAALGRIAFAALPNVKPTTDIVLISGYALGGAPGFVVGALTGLVSNFFFGQGPWTPWQMAAWAATGMLGAGLAVITRRHIARVPLAVVCAVVGYAFAAIQDVGDWVTYSDHSAAQLGVYVARGTGFDFVHAGGCLVFALAFGPALIRSVQRFARRLQVHWHPAGEIAAMALVAVAVAAPVSVSAVPARAASTPAGYLLAAQNSDGGFGEAPHSSSSELFSGWAALGLAAAGHNPLQVSHGGATLLDYVRGGVGSLPDVGALERTILVARAAGQSVQSFGGRDLIAELERHIRGDGSVQDQVNLTAFAVLALRAARVPPSGRTISWLARQQDSDGGFSFATAGGGSDVDDTGAALEALNGGHAAARAVAFLRHQQARDGGFPSQPGGDPNAQSTAWAVQGLLAAGVDPGSLHRGGAPSPLQFLAALTAADGHIRYAHDTDQTPVWVTAQALMALDGKPLPLAPVALKSSAAVQPAGHRGTAGGAARPRSAQAAKQPHRAPARARQRRTRRGAGEAAAGSPTVNVYAAGAGLLTALALAPVGIG
jgi:energy-coupling factor transport system substrate-specific component